MPKHRILQRIGLHGIHEIYKLYEIHLPKNRNPQHLGLHEIHCVTVEINTDLMWS